MSQQTGGTTEHAPGSFGCSATCSNHRQGCRHHRQRGRPRAACCLKGGGPWTGVPRHRPLTARRAGGMCTGARRRGTGRGRGPHPGPQRCTPSRSSTARRGRRWRSRCPRTGAPRPPPPPPAPRPPICSPPLPTAGNAVADQALAPPMSTSVR